jgi:hypothetical protein
MVKLELKPSEYILRNFTLTKACSPRTSPQPARQPQHELSLQSERRGRGGEISPDPARPMWQNSEFPTSAPMDKNTAWPTLRRTVAGTCYAVNDVLSS